jgi:hypothetical protein
MTRQELQVRMFEYLVTCLVLVVVAVAAYVWDARPFLVVPADWALTGVVGCDGGPGYAPPGVMSGAQISQDAPAGPACLLSRGCWGGLVSCCVQDSS